MRWVEKHREEMKESATSPEEVSPAFRNIYRYRESLSKRILYQHYFIPKFEKFIQEHMRWKVLFLKNAVSGNAIVENVHINFLTFLR